MKQISVIIPCYNAEAYLKRCIESVLHQTIGIEKLEVIMVNDASTDHTLDVMLEYENLYPEDILVVNCEKNGRQGTARNIGLQYASCDYVSFIDADDWIEKEMYEVLYRKAKQEDLDRVGCAYDRVASIEDAMKNVAEQIKIEEKRLDIRNDSDQRLYLEWKDKGGVCSSIYKKSVILKNEIFFPEGLIYEDNYWTALMRFYEKRVCVTDQILYHYYVNADSVTGKKNNPALLDRLIIEIMKMEEYKKRGIYERFQCELDKRFLELYWTNSLHVFFCKLTCMPVGLLREMQNTVKSLVAPDILEKQIETGKWFYTLLNEEVTQQQLNEIQAAYVEAIS